MSIILARGGSKGIKDKNITTLKGKPLIYYSINASKLSRVDHTWVSTDSAKIKNIAMENGCEVLDRPKKYATDQSKSEESLIHFSKNVDFDILVFIQPTSPLILYSDINEGLEMMNNYDSIFSAYAEHWLPRWTKSNNALNWEINKRPMRQDIDDCYVENGAFYITTKKNLEKSGLRYSGKIGIYKMPFSRSFQVDTLDDLLLIEKVMSTE